MIDFFKINFKSSYLIFKSYPYSDEFEKLKLPRNIEDAKQLGFLLAQYTDNYYYTVLSGYVITYIL